MPNAEFRVRFSISPATNERLAYWARATGDKESALARRALLLLLDQLDSSRSQGTAAAAQESGEPRRPGVREVVTRPR